MIVIQIAHELGHLEALHYLFEWEKSKLYVLPSSHRSTSMENTPSYVHLPDMLHESKLYFLEGRKSKLMVEWKEFVITPQSRISRTPPFLSIPILLQSRDHGGFSRKCKDTSRFPAPLHFGN